MVTVLQLWMTHTLESAIKKATEKNLPIPQHLVVYMDDCWCGIKCQPPRRLALRSSINYIDPTEAFNNCLNEVHNRVKFTREAEEDGKIAFLDVLITRKDNGSMTTQIYRKPSNTNVIICPNSCHDSKFMLQPSREKSVVPTVYARHPRKQKRKSN
jgi:hypothetical protein